MDYIDITDEQIAKLEASEVLARASAIIMILRGAQKGIITTEESDKQILNIALSLVITG